ncbi:IPT/TIG domain-containing protein [Candidatus Methanoperedens nitroreducens]|uniref:IPT/TIG domain-containing protein n=1 Tax=Candidatus Methanoperedens nitratireducens TaxID=1392998 RepID=A0A062VD25_9EURY|nr:IPT/TIG domain-containing protein [Candidatus Methanoperedens nitroreducens]KCZ73554.1 IPT/TIG domain-containing protein [Candidatus Methanoperedens nitroreducens]MDJ1422486.1 IPT/TIG domain-containing protein [Candidatus Methanoperedens sp.]
MSRIGSIIKSYSSKNYLIHIFLIFALFASLIFITIVPVEATPGNYTGDSSTCKTCHSAQYALWANSTHTSKLITRDDAIARGYPNPPGGYSWENVSLVIGSKWKIRYVNDTGYIITTGGKNQFNVDDQIWTDYNKDAIKKYNCGHCHGTGYLSNVADTVKEPFRTLRNQGQIPDGVYDNSSTPGFKGYWAENSVGCEACHGPGEEHVNSPSTLNIRNASVVRNTPQICGDCHSRPLASKYGEYDDFKPYPYGVNDSLLIETLTDNSPMPTVNYSLTGGHHEQWEDLKASGHAANAVNCANCHGGHAISDQAYAGGPTGKIKFNNGTVYPAAVKQSCTDCHASELPKHGLYNDNSKCISCHMPQNRKSSNKIDLRSHWFDITALRDNKNAGVHAANLPALESFAPQSCNTCHKATPGNFTGDSSTCKVCHKDEYALWANTTHTSKLITRDDAMARGYPNPPGGYSWENVSFVIGSKWKIRYVNDTGYIVTTGGKNQFNIDDQIWTDYNKDTIKKYNCGHCHGTGYLSNVTDTIKEPFRTLRNQGQIPDGVYDNSLTPGFKGYWAENSVGCEACHGNGGDHVLSPSTLNIRNASVVRNTPQICGDCHSRPLASKYGEYDDFKPYPYGVNDSLLSETLTDDSPMPTVDYSKTGGHHEQWEDLKASGHAANAVSCANCHGGHAISDQAYAGGPTGKIKFNNGTVYPAAVSQTCTICHALELPKHGYYTVNSECISCHMPQNRKSSNKIDLRSHWFDANAMKNNKNTGVHALSFATLQNIDESCVNCHSSANLSKPIDTASAGVHKDINKSEGIGLLKSSDCKSCHYGASTSSILSRNCDACHVDQVITSPKVDEHTDRSKDVAVTASCALCHNNSINKFKYSNNASVSHYGTANSLINTSNCIDCHNGAYTGNASWGSPVNISTSSKRQHTETQTNQCDSCHKDSSVPTLAAVTFHNSSVKTASPPPVNQNLGLYDTRIAFVPSETCKGCHVQPQNTHHLMLGPNGNTNLGCLDCHPTQGTYPSQYQYIERSCQNCHNGTAFWANPAVNLAQIRPPGRPHHNTTKNSASNLAVQAAYWAIDRQCNKCHGSSILANYNDGHYYPSYDTSLVTPLADYKVKNATTGKEWGGCRACHNSGPDNILNNRDTHHNATSGMQGRKCTYCHVGNPSSPRTDGSASPLRIYLTDEYGLGWDTTNLHMELRNSTILNAGDAVNGTGCQQCHSVVSLHNIQYNYVQGGGPAGYGHINNNADCNVCHAFWDAGMDNPFLGSVAPGMSSVTPDTLTPGVASEVTITGTNFVQEGYTTNVLVDGNAMAVVSVTDTQIEVTIPALSAGVHSIQLEKGGVTSKLSSLAVIEPVDVVTAKLASGKITVTGTGFSVQPDPAFSDLGVFVTKKGQETTFKAEVISWSDTEIVVSGSGASTGNLLEVKALNGEDSTSISGGGKK